MTLLDEMEAWAEQTQAPAIEPLRPFDPFPLIERELRVYYIGDKIRDPYAVTYNGRGIYLANTDYLYADFRRDVYGWIDFELSRQEATWLITKASA